MDDDSEETTRFALPRWAHSSHRTPPWIRLWLAGFVIAGCTLAGLREHCDDMAQMADVGLVALVLAVAIQCASALGSFVTILVACVRRDFGRAGVEAFIFVGMLLVIPLAILAQVSALPECPAPLTGG
jgi:hypothetical protein